MEINREKKNYGEKEEEQISENFSSIDLSKAEMIIEGKEDVIIFHITDFEIDYYYYWYISERNLINETFIKA
jgi:hypothetical protein